MANVSQGTTVTWGGLALGEVVSVSVDGVQADTLEVTPRGSLTRLKSYKAGDVDYGKVSLTCRSAAVMTATNVGLTATLSIGGPSVSWSFPVAIFQSLGWSAAVGELQTYTVNFKLGA